MPFQIRVVHNKSVRNLLGDERAEAKDVIKKGSPLHVRVRRYPLHMNFVKHIFNVYLTIPQFQSEASRGS